MVLLPELAGAVVAVAGGLVERLLGLAEGRGLALEAFFPTATVRRSTGIVLPGQRVEPRRVRQQVHTVEEDEG
jgi:hypothetical protein